MSVPVNVSCVRRPRYLRPSRRQTVRRRCARPRFTVVIITIFFVFTVFSARGFIRKVSRLILTPRRRRSRKTRRRRAARRAVVTDGKGPATVVLFRSVAPFPKRTRADKTNVLTRNGRSPRVIGSTVFRSNTIFKADVYYRPMRFGRAVIRGSANVRFTPLSDVAPRGRSVGAPTSRTRREPLLLFLLYYNYFMLFFFFHY